MAVSGLGILAATSFDLLLALVIPGIFLWAALIILSFHPDEDRKFLTQLFLISFALRAGAGVVIYLLNLADFFGADAYTYDGYGAALANQWSGLAAYRYAEGIGQKAHPGYIYFVAGLYYLTGQQPLVAQAVNWVFGSFTVYLIFLIARKMFDRRVAVYSAIFAGVMPGFVIWEAQLLKDTIIIFSLCLCIYSVMNLQERFSFSYGIMFMVSLVILYFFRIYIFYIMGAASALSLFVGQRIGLLPMVIIMTILFGGFALIAQQAGLFALMSEEQERHFGKVDAFQRMDNLRRSLAGQGAAGGVGSSYMADADISTPEKAIAFLPVGILYLLMAPFPWMIRNFRQAITLPEMLVWWYLIPSLIRGLVYGVKERFTYVSSPLLFSLGLTLMYALFQGNVGTAYRQRTQIFIFYFIFISAGLLLKKSRGTEAS